MTKYIILILILTFKFIECTTKTPIPEYVIKKEKWENNYRENIVNKYNNNELKEHFLSLSLDATKVANEIDEAINEIIKYETGKSIIVDIVSALEPRVLYGESLRTIICNINNEEKEYEKVKIIFALIENFSPNSILNTNEIHTYVANKMYNDLVGKIDSAPEEIIISDIDLDTFELYYKELDEDLKSTLYIKDILEKIIQEIETKINKYRFLLTIGEDNYYDAENKNIILSSKETELSVISGPILQTYGKTVDVVSQPFIFENDEKLLHEIIHYYNLTLRQDLTDNDFNSLNIQLIKNGFSTDYTDLTLNIWSDTEELRTITGLIVINGKLMYSKQCEARYLKDKKKPFRFSHSSSYFTKCPWYFVELMEKIGITVYLKNYSCKDYTRKIDSL